jgi:hypothetical protein
LKIIGENNMSNKNKHRDSNNGKRKNVKYYKVCGICGERYPQSSMIKDGGSDTGWVCRDCLIDLHPEYLEEFESIC